MVKITISNCSLPGTEEDLSSNYRDISTGRHTAARARRIYYISRANHHNADKISLFTFSHSQGSTASRTCSLDPSRTIAQILVVKRGEFCMLNAQGFLLRRFLHGLYNKFSSRTIFFGSSRAFLSVTFGPSSLGGYLGSLPATSASTGLHFF